MNYKQTPETVYSPLFSRKIVALQSPIPVACEAGAKRGGGEEENRVPPFPPSPNHLLLSMPAAQVTYLWWSYWFQVYLGVV